MTPLRAASDPRHSPQTELLELQIHCECVPLLLGRAIESTGGSFTISPIARRVCTALVHHGTGIRGIWVATYDGPTTYDE